MGSYRIEGLARNCPRDKFYTWYTDFGPEDPELIARYITQPISVQVLARRVISREGNHIQFENIGRLRGRDLKWQTDVILSPESYTYEAIITTLNMFEDRRRYSFIETPEGSKVIDDGVYTVKSLGLKIADALGLLKPRFVRESQAIMDAFCRAAEDEIGRDKLMGKHSQAEHGRS